MTKERKRLLSWLPATILLVIIVGIIATTMILLKGGLGAPAASPTPGQVTQLNWSIFTKAGLGYIDKTRQVRIDFKTQPVEAKPLGLKADDTLTIGPHISGADYYLIVNGGGAGQGGDKFTVTQMTITTQGGVITDVHAPLSDVVNFRKTLTYLLQKAEIFGWDTSGVQAIYDKVEVATHDGVPYQFGFGPSNLAGVPVSATASCGTDGYCQVEYDVTPAVR